jgi:hypothetical protein
MTSQTARIDAVYDFADIARCMKGGVQPAPDAASVVAERQPWL